MPITIRFEHQPNFLHARLEGEYQIQEAIGVLGRVFAECAAGDAHGLLLDVLALRGAPTIMDRYKISLVYAEHTHAIAMARDGRRLRIATVGTPPMTDPTHFGEDVAINRGVNLRVFSELDAARAWLNAP